MSGFFDGFAGLELPLPNGRLLRAKVLPLATAVRFLRLAEKMATFAADGTEIPAEDPEARFTILAEFPQAVELLDGTSVDVWNELTIAEFWVVFWGFFGPRGKREAPPSPATAAAPSPSLGTGS